MMNCRQVSERLTMFVLGELDRSSQADVGAHLQECDGCRAEEAELRSDIGRLRSALHTELQAPSGLIDRVERAVSVGRPRIRPFRMWISAASAAALLLMVYSLWFPLRDTGRTSVAQVLSEFSASTAMPVEAPTVSHIASLSRQVGFEIDSTPIQPGAQLTDCRIIRHGNALGAVVSYDVDGRRVKVYQIPANSVLLDRCQRMRKFDKDIYCRSQGSLSLVAWNCRGCVFIAVGEMSEEELAELAEPLIRAA